MATGSRTQGTLGPNSSESDQNNNNNGRAVVDKSNSRQSTFATGRLMSNLPYMGELTFDTRPRRGRKPKKADICHLISKNYGISFPLAYVNQPNSSLDGQGFDMPLAAIPQQSPAGSVSMISSKNEDFEIESEEPLNLCLRDRTTPTVVVDSSDQNLVRPKANTNRRLLQAEPNRTEPERVGRGRKRVKKVQIRSTHTQPPPPLPSEVSICKFKFTGGVKPTLQEKKMLSVDSGGNFRFYSDKQPLRVSTKGQGNLKLPSPTPQFPQLEPELILSPMAVEHPPPPSSPGGDSSSSDDRSSSPTSEFGCKRKRRTRKSLMREKLEKTFKEKGFLIQTQQLESAEGATYCKFRQLRKFTRYLFRSWKDYLPENVQGISGGNPLDAAQGSDPVLSQCSDSQVQAAGP